MSRGGCSQLSLRVSIFQGISKLGTRSHGCQHCSADTDLTQGHPADIPEISSSWSRTNLSLGHPLNSHSRGQVPNPWEWARAGSEQNPHPCWSSECWLHWPQRERNLLQEGRRGTQCPTPVPSCVLCDLPAVMGSCPFSGNTHTNHASRQLQ